MQECYANPHPSGRELTACAFECKKTVTAAAHSDMDVSKDLELRYILKLATGYDWTESGFFQMM